jgi:hypothetical protein
MKKRILVLAALTVLTVSIGYAKAGDILPGFDLLNTPNQSASIPGLGNVMEQGVPIGPGNTDTIVQRFNGLADGQSGVINAQIVALSIAGSIVSGPFTGDTFSVKLDPSHASLGQLNVTNPPGPGGGTFTSFFDVFTDITISQGSNVVAIVPHEDLLSSVGTTPWAEIPAPNYPNDPSHPSGGFYITPAGINFTGPLPHVDPAAITPEPASLTLLGIAAASGLGYIGWRRRKLAPA